ncbi:hypothetical protein BV898_05438 [Hypsibius exemplaris]|uniref:Gustatory receptor n=1 Tax=Hypsibius exemplaris TaxID=2072580 RepID=A0A1W0WZJ2_HYPEX|nr:hypothetical protein BV898_05438 [Hypsibius exemplaris]
MRTSQEVLMEFLGVIPVSRRLRLSACGYFRSCVAVVILCGAAFQACANVTRLMLSFIYPATQSFGSTGLLSTMSNVPYTAMAIRSFCVLATLFFKPTEWNKLCGLLAELIRVAGPETNKYAKKLQATALYVLVLSSVSHVCWYAFAWSYKGYGYFGECLDDALMKGMRVWHYCIFQFIFEMLPFVLSLHVFTSAVLMVTLLYDIIRMLGVQMGEVIDRISAERLLTSELLARSEYDLGRWMKVHLLVMLVRDAINETFGGVFLCTFVADTACLLCKSAKLLSLNSSSPPLMYAYIAVTVCIFGIYSTVWPLPMVLALERVQ